MRALSDGAGAGFTGLVVSPRAVDQALLVALAGLVGPSGLVLHAGPRPARGEGWRALRCDPAAGIPVRSHIADFAVVIGAVGLGDVAAEVRRVLAPRGDARVLVAGAGAAAIEALADVGLIAPRRLDAGADGIVLVARGP